MGRLGEEIIFTPRDEAQAQFVELLDEVSVAINSMKG